MEFCICRGEIRRSSSYMPWSKSLEFDIWQDVLNTTELDPNNLTTPNPNLGRGGSVDSISSSSESSCVTNKTNLSLDNIIPKDAYLPVSKTKPQIYIEKSEKNHGTVKLHLIEHISDFRYPPGEKRHCVFCQKGKCTHTPNTLSALSRGKPKKVIHFIFILLIQLYQGYFKALKNYSILM